MMDSYELKKSISILGSEYSKPKRKENTSWFLVSVCFIFMFTTETLSIRMNGGNLRGYYVVNLLIVFLNLKYVNKIINNRILVSLLLFMFMLLFTTITSGNITGAFVSSVSLILNMIGAFVVFLVLASGQISLDRFDKLIYFILILNVLYGLFIFLLYKTTGISIGFTTFAAHQLSGWQIAGFRTEANTHGKLVCYTVIYCLPHIVHSRKNRRYIFLMLAAIVTLIISPTRSATYALLISLFFSLLYYYRKNTSRKIIKFSVFAIVVMIIVSFLLNTGVFKIEGYSSFKLNNFFLTNISEVKNDGSGGFRFESMETALNLWMQSYKTIAVGRGYGQTYAYLQRGLIYSKTSGIEIVGILTGVGVLGLLVWLNMFIVQIKLILRRIRRYKLTYESGECTNKIMLEVMIFVTIYIFAIGFTSGIIYCPETWLTFGLSAYLITIKKKSREV